MGIKNMPEDDRPREKMLQKGAAALSIAELLAILIRTGSKQRSALEIARELVDTDEKLMALRVQKPAELAMQKGIGPAKAVTVVAALELGRRLAVEQARERTCVNSTLCAVDILMPQLRHEDKENCLVMLLNAKSDLLSIEKISQGSLLNAIVQPREIFQAAILHRAVAFILAHNHPSGDPRPSKEDIATTENISKASMVMGIPMVDHIIIGDGRYFSFKEQGYIN